MQWKSCRDFQVFSENRFFFFFRTKYQKKKQIFLQFFHYFIVIYEYIVNKDCFVTWGNF